MAKQNIKLIIWDFDGVIADTEKLWLLNRQKLINEELGIGWNFTETNKYLGGMSDKTKKAVLDAMNIKTDQNFWNKAANLDKQTMEKGFALTPHIEEIFKLKQFKQCIATGGILSKTILKMQITGAYKYFDLSRVFTADMVNCGKPAPDLFLLAAHKMRVYPEECVVIEDSIAGMKAGLAAGMRTVAFTGCEMNRTTQHLQAVKKLGIKNIFYDMVELKNYLLTLNQ